MTVEGAESRTLIERPPRPLTGPRRVRRDLGALYAANGLIGLIFAATGPVAVILAVGTQGGLTQAELASWVFGVFFLNGLLTVLACWVYRQPLAFFWTIPGTVLVGPALGHLSWPEVVGAFVATGLLMLVLGLTGWVRRVMDLIPMPIVMGMVAGVFLRFGTDLVRALGADVAVAAPMVLVFLLLSARPALGRWVPPIIGALRGRRGRRRVSGRFDPGRRPRSGSPPRCCRSRSGRCRRWSSWSSRSRSPCSSCRTARASPCSAPRATTPPVNAITIACGVWSLLAAGSGRCPPA